MIFQCQTAARFGLLTHCYDSFSKANFAALTKAISESAVAGDKLCVWLFEEAGRMLGRHIRALSGIEISETRNVVIN